MGIFDSDDDKATASTIKIVLGMMPANARREVTRDLSDEDATTVRKVLAASRTELRAGTRTCDKCRAGKHGACAGQGCSCG
jgi:hypothetical protein